MKKVLILRRSFLKNYPLVKYLRKNLGPGIKVITGKWSDLFFEIKSDVVEVYLKDQPIEEFNLVWFRGTSGRIYPLAKALASILEVKKIKYFDTGWGKNKIRGDKLASYVSFALAGLPVISSVFCLGEKIKERKKQISARLGLPLVAKDVQKNRGKGIFPIKNEKDFEKIIKEAKDGVNFLFQKFYPNNSDYRVLVLGEEVIAWEKQIRYGEKDKTWAFMVDQEEFLPLEKIPKEWVEISQKAAKIADLQIAGVDFLKDHDSGKFWLLEVNRSPGFTPDLKISPELPLVASFIKKTLRQGK